MQLSQKRVLLAEDDPDIATLLIRTLSTEYQVCWAKNGPDAVCAAADLHPNLLLLDVMMPGLDGLEVARLIRQQPALSRVPIIFLTAKSAPMDIIQGIQHGARHYITKPFKLDDVRGKVRATLGAPPPQAPS